MTLLLLLLLAQQPSTHQLCQQCHTEAATDVESHPHFAKGVTCDSCHGTSQKHRDASGHAPPDRIASREQVPPLCGTCHPKELKSFETSKHWVALKASAKAPQCATCHGNHSLRSIKAMQSSCERCHATLPAACAATPKLNPKLRCAGCHQPHDFKKQP
jgi:hypothetical protein